MRIEFHGPPMCDFSQFRKDGTVEVPDGMTLKKFLKFVKLPTIWRKVFPLLLNYDEVTDINVVLKDGDIVSAFTPLGGG